MPPSIDPMTFEILKNRLFAITEEAAETIKFVSGSPVANQVYDFNTGLMTAEGDVFAMGTYISIHAIPLNWVVRTILNEYRENPGIGEDDMFICNDPYEGAVHQSDVVVVAPIHWEGELVAWCGAVIHQVDVGGPKPGQVGVGAGSIYEEAIPMPCVKLVEGGRVRRDLEKEYLIRSRARRLVSLDLKAKIAANNTAKERLRELFRVHGRERILGVTQQIIDYTEGKFRARLKELPDGTWRHRSYMDYSGDIYKGFLAMKKAGDRLIFDYTGTSKQAPAVVNSTYAGTEAYTLCAVLAALSYDDIPWCPAGILRAVEILAPEGSFINARWPAGASKSTTAAGSVVRLLAGACLARILDASEEHKDRVLAPEGGSIGVEELFGLDPRGVPFYGPMLDSMGTGLGARSYKDGVDTGGRSHIPAAAIIDMETAEASYPLLYLYRRQERDSGGAGMYRGGMAISLMYTPHDVPRINKIQHYYGLSPESPGISGAYPAAKNFKAHLRGTNVEELFRQGIMPQSFAELSGELELTPAICETSQERGDLFLAVPAACGGGYGDPIDRDPRLVQQDVVNGAVSREAAQGIYGVVLEPQGLAVDYPATEARRGAIREERRRLGALPSPAGAEGGAA